uniref:glutathione transferase n=1 Tax=Lygus hesperus TaxID=30085 RepID=A0A0K8SR46_LYGHE
MPETKLKYFNGRALGEPIRYLLSYLNRDFEDIRFEPEEWPSIKPTMPFGKAPILEIEGKVVHQSTAICRYLGAEAGLAGKNNWENLQIDMAVDTFHDFRQACANFQYLEDETLKAKKKAQVLKDVVPEFLQKFDNLVKENGGYIANGKLSWGDLYVVGISTYIQFMIGYDPFEKYSNLSQLRDKVEALPQIKAWNAKRPKTEW